MLLYTIDCPQCLILKKKLEQKGILYEISNDFDILIEKGIEFLPVLQVNNDLMIFEDAIKYIDTL